MRPPAPILLLAALLCPLPAAADQDPGSSRGSPDPLFASDDFVPVGFQADFKRVFKDRDTTTREWSPAVVRWATGEKAESVAVEVGTRGHFRLKFCGFPPLRLRFSKETSEGTLWAKAGTIKLVTHCRSNYDHIVLLEYLTYRIYNLLTPASFRVRLVQATYRDDGSNGKEETRWAFFLEDADHMARRVGGKIFDPMGMSFALADSTDVAMMSAFSYMVGFTDWSLPYLHNVRVIDMGGGRSYHPVPYDFDWSGLVNAPYAKPNPMLNIRHVRERVWRGPCLSEGLLDATLDRILAKREEIHALIRGQQALEAKRQEDAIKYLEEFFTLAQDRRKAHREMRRVCQ